MYRGWVLVFISLRIISTSFCDGRSVYYVKPSADGQCPDDPCYTLGEYLRYRVFSQSNATFYFLQGMHTIDRAGMENIIAVSHLSFVGINWQSPFNNISSDSSIQLPVIIKCDADFGLLFLNTASILVTNITIYCGAELSYPPEFRAAISFLNSSAIEIVGVKIMNSRGYGLYILNAHGKSRIGRSKFISNKGGEVYNGGNVYLEYHFTQNYCGLKPVHFSISASEFTKGFSPLPYSYLSPGFHVKIHHYCVNITITFDNVIMVSNNRKTADKVEGGNLGILITEPVHTTGQHHISITNSQIKNGIARRGGGITFQVYRDSVYSDCETGTKPSTSIINSLTISNTLIMGNKASRQGGGYYGVINNVCQKYSIMLSSVNFTDNQALRIFGLESILWSISGQDWSGIVNGGNVAFELKDIGLSQSVHSIVVENSIFQHGASEVCGGLCIMLWYNTSDVTSRPLAIKIQLIMYY